MRILNSKEIILLFFITFLKGNVMLAQQMPQYTNYMYNPSAINPAFAGHRDKLSATIIHRSQWLGFEGAPVTDAFSVNSPFNNGKIGLGINITSDATALTNNTSINGDFSYTIFGQKSNLTFGAKVGLQRYSLDKNKLKLEDQTDPDFLSFKDATSPQIGFGLMYNTSNLTLGISVPNVLEKEYSQSLENIYINSERRNYYLSAAYNFNISPNTLLKTTALSKLVIGAPLQLDFSANFLLYQKLTIGLGYRPDAAVSGLLGYQLSDSFMIGCAYDYDTTEFTNVNSGSAEFIMRYEINLKPTSLRILNPRIF